MANSLFDWARQGFLSGAILWDANSIKVLLVTGGYSPNLNSTVYRASAFAAGAGVIWSSTVALSSTTVASGVADALDHTLTTVTGNSASAMVIYQDTGASATSRLIAFIDTATGLPVTPNGGDITIQWDNTAATKIFCL